MVQATAQLSTFSPVRHAPTVTDARLALARELAPFARVVRDRAGAQADTIGAIDRRFGSDEVRHLARLLDDLWMAADSFVADVETMGEG